MSFIVLRILLLFLYLRELLPLDRQQILKLSKLLQLLYFVHFLRFLERVIDGWRPLGVLFSILNRFEVPADELKRLVALLPNLALDRADILEILLRGFAWRKLLADNAR